MAHSTDKTTNDHQHQSFKDLPDGTSARQVCGNPGATPIPVDQIPGVQTPKITNLSAPVSGSEASHVIPDGTRKIFIKVRGNAIAQIAFVSTESGSKFVTIPMGTNYSEENLNTSSLTVYIQTNKASQIIEILTWD